MSTGAGCLAERGADEARMTPEAERLQQFLRFSAPFGPIGTVIVLGFWWIWDVDDDPLARDILRRALERVGWSVHEAENGRCALDGLAEARPTLVLLDLMMPEMDGFEFLAKLRDQPDWGHVPVLVVTAKTLSASERSRLNGDVGKILQKGSYTRKELLAEVSTLVGAAARRQPHPS